MACKFCEEYKFWRSSDRMAEKEANGEDLPFVIDHEYKACLLRKTVRIWNDGTRPKRNNGGEITSKGFRLRFCPECGRRIQGRGKR